jgi:hypothetical protein
MESLNTEFGILIDNIYTENGGFSWKCKKMNTKSNFGTYKYNVIRGQIITLKQYKRMEGFIRGLTEIKRNSSFLNEQ